MLRIGFFILLNLLCSSNLLTAQDQKLIKRADALFAENNFPGALKIYEQAIEEAKEDPYLNHQIAQCFLNSSPKTKSLQFAFNAVKFSEKPTNDMYFSLARAYHLNHEFDKAIDAYQKSDPGNANKKTISKFTKECQFGKRFLSEPVKVKITNAGKFINTYNQEYLPYITADLSKMYFTSRRADSKGGKKAPDGLFFEDIYFSSNKGGAWQEAENIGPPLNSDGHDACIGISPDGQLMFVYKGENGGDIFTSELKGDKWSKPEPMSVNTEFFETSACISPDGRTLFFTRAMQFNANRDIYICSRNVSGNWTKPKKVPTINTEFDEDAPFIHPDGKTLYFSSKGHSSMGGYDVFKSTMRPDGSFSEPVNLGYPINTASDDIYFVLSADGKIGFYSSDREGGFGKQDIYSIRMPVNEKAPELALLKGTVKDQNSSKALETQITISDNKTGETLALFNSNSATGEYLVSLPSGKNYNIAIEKEGYVFYSENVFLSDKEGYKEFRKDIKLAPLVSGATVVLKNIFFDSGKHELKAESTTELKRLAKLLEENPKLSIEIAGHTDNTGNDQANIALSETRAVEVMKFLTRLGIPSTRLSAKGYGSSQALDTNDTAEGRQNNRRTEFKIK
jgi:outer membrane protein OmpA-like peptidoglycan-associated protein